ncbi:MAG: phenylalanine--tRNA ligase subunit alpha, partial [Anaerolineae bacterium]|nr:phenylalanine--tRNA ligase subunit alpha [Anaerolineae bacterium]
MLDKLEQIQEKALTTLQAAQDDAALQHWKVAHLGRKSPLMDVFTQMGDLSKEERPKVGQRANQVRIALEAAFEEKTAALKQAVIQSSLDTQKLDVTLPGRSLPRGRLHPITQTLRRIYAIFAEMGFQVYRSPDVETDENNFELLNIPAHHPARDMWDTFHLNAPGIILRTHTSPGQIHAMRQYAPEPVRVILPGMCYRYEQVNTRSEMQFTQVEGLAVGHNITFGDLKGTL